MDQIRNIPSTTPLQSGSIRYLKIREKILQRSASENAHFPELILCGKWMQDLGFTSFQTARIECSPGMIIITPFPSGESIPDTKPPGKRK